MSDFLSLILPFIGDSWFIQGLIINTVFTIGSIPFTKNTIKNAFRKRRKERIKNAQNELKILCAQKMIAENSIEKDYFENHLFMLASKYNLNIEEIYNDEKSFGKKIINTILKTDIIDIDTKEEISQKIRNNKMFVNMEYRDIIDENGNILSSENDSKSFKEDIEFSKDEKQNMSKVTLIITIC